MDGARWLRRVQRGGGGWGLATTGIVNTQSTSWAVQGLIAADAGGGALRKGLAYIERQRVADGHYRYSAATDQTPIWVTAQALLAAEREPLPLPVVARAPKPTQARDDDDDAAAPDAADSLPGVAAADAGSGTAPNVDGGRDSDEGDDRGRPDAPASRAGGDDAAAPAAQVAQADAPPAAAEPATASVEAAAEPSSTTTSGDGDETLIYIAVGTVVAALGAGYWARRQRSAG
jgi:hypothetical protein